MMLSRDELRVLMLPWVGVLRDYVDLGEWHAKWDAHGDRIVWMQMVSDAPRGIEPRAFDAMELLTLLGEIDFGAWRVALAASWPRHATMWIEAANGHALRMGWKLVFHSSTITTEDGAMEIDKWCDRVALDGVVRTRSREYLRARTVLEKLYTELEHATDRTWRKPVERQRLQIPVQLVMKQGPLEGRLLKMLQIASLQHARETSSVSLFRNDPWKPLMRITDVDTSAIAQQASAKAFLNAAQLAAFDVRLNQLSLDRLDVTVDTAMLYTTGLQYLLATKVEPGVVPSVGVVRSVVVPATMQRQTIAAIFSALVATQSSCAVSVNKTPTIQHAQDEDVTKMTPEDRDWMWQWIAVSLFSRYASTQLTQVEIDVGDLGQKDVVAMERALQFQHALADLCLSASERGSSSFDVEEFVSASTFRLVSPDTEVPRGVEAYINLERQSVRVLDKRSDGWAVVLVAGWGTAWVHADDYEACVTHPVVRSEPRPLSSLTLSNVNAWCMPAVISLLRVVATDLRSLELTVIKVVDPLDDWVRDILRACPRLEELKFTGGGHLRTLDTITDTYERGFARVRQLTLRDTPVEDAAGMPRFFQALADPSHAMSKHLQGFSFSCKMRDPMPDVSEALHTMLKANTTLERLDLKVRFLSPMSPDQLIQRRAFIQYETPLAVRLLPLSLSKKAAFLSVTGPRRDLDGSSSAVQQFDSRIASIIFQFAAQCSKRYVNVQFWNHGPVVRII